MEFRFPRLPVRCAITFSGDYVFGEGTVVNLSEGGWRVRSPTTRVPTGVYLTLQILLPNEDTPIKVDEAVVRWSKGREFGLEFLRMQAKEKARLRRCISLLSRERTLEEFPVWKG